MSSVSLGVSVEVSVEASAEASYPELNGQQRQNMLTLFDHVSFFNQWILLKN